MMDNHHICDLPMDNICISKMYSPENLVQKKDMIEKSMFNLPQDDLICNFWRMGISDNVCMYVYIGK